MLLMLIGIVFPCLAMRIFGKLEFYGTSAGQKAIGNTHGYWICTFRNSCEVCIDRHGNSYSIEELLDMYPAHDWCECLISFYKKT